MLKWFLLSKPVDFLVCFALSIRRRQMDYLMVGEPWLDNLGESGGIKVGPDLKN